MSNLDHLIFTTSAKIADFLPAWQAIRPACKPSQWYSISRPAFWASKHGIAPDDFDEAALARWLEAGRNHGRDILDFEVANLRRAVDQVREAGYSGPLPSIEARRMRAAQARAAKLKPQLSAQLELVARAHGRNSKNTVKKDLRILLRIHELLVAAGLNIEKAADMWSDEALEALYKVGWANRTPHWQSDHTTIALRARFLDLGVQYLRTLKVPLVQIQNLLDERDVINAKAKAKGINSADLTALAAISAEDVQKIIRELRAVIGRYVMNPIWPYNERRARFAIAGLMSLAIGKLPTELFRLEFSGAEHVMRNGKVRKCLQHPTFEHGNVEAGLSDQTILAIDTCYKTLLRRTGTVPHELMRESNGYLPSRTHYSLWVKEVGKAVGVHLSPQIMVLIAARAVIQLHVQGALTVEEVAVALRISQVDNLLSRYQPLIEQVHALAFARSVVGGA